MTVATKGSEHPWFGIGFSAGYVLQGTGISVINLQGQNIAGTPVQGAALQLVRGVRYAFDLTFVPSSHPFIITTSSVGATTTGLTQGAFGSIVTFTPDANTPSQLYYQCTNHASMGGIITIVDPSPSINTTTTTTRTTTTTTSTTTTSTTTSTTTTRAPFVLKFLGSASNIGPSDAFKTAVVNALLAIGVRVEAGAVTISSGISFFKANVCLYLRLCFFFFFFFSFLTYFLPLSSLGHTQTPHMLHASILRWAVEILTVGEMHSRSASRKS